MNYLGIELNNFAVSELKKGNTEKAFELLSYACQKSTQKHHAHVDSSHKTYRYAWEDCTMALTKKMCHISKFDEGCMPFLYLKFLIIETPLGRESVAGLCPCGFAWVLWYK
jgi:hypothetical protein